MVEVSDEKIPKSGSFFPVCLFSLCFFPLCAFFSLCLFSLCSFFSLCLLPCVFATLVTLVNTVQGHSGQIGNTPNLAEKNQNQCYSCFQCKIDSYLSFWQWKKPKASLKTIIGFPPHHILRPLCPGMTKAFWGFFHPEGCGFKFHGHIWIPTATLAT